MTPHSYHHIHSPFEQGRSPAVYQKMTHRLLEKNWRTAGTQNFYVAKLLKCWRSLGETADDFRNADKSEGNCIACSLSDTSNPLMRSSNGVGAKAGRRKLIIDRICIDARPRLCALSPARLSAWEECRDLRAASLHCRQGTSSNPCLTLYCRKQDCIFGESSFGRTTWPRRALCVELTTLSKTRT